MYCIFPGYLNSVTPLLITTHFILAIPEIALSVVSCISVVTLNSLGSVLDLQIPFKPVALLDIPPS